jgi:hypothetical protein
MQAVVVALRAPAALAAEFWLFLSQFFPSSERASRVLGIGAEQGRRSESSSCSRRRFRGRRTGSCGCIPARSAWQRFRHLTMDRFDTVTSCVGTMALRSCEPNFWRPFAFTISGIPAQHCSSRRERIFRKSRSISGTCRFVQPQIGTATCMTKRATGSAIGLTTRSLNLPRTFRGLRKATATQKRVGRPRKGA